MRKETGNGDAQRGNQTGNGDRLCAEGESER
jgi:hypothetical protein